jgi:hypothetical protein
MPSLVQAPDIALVWRAYRRLQEVEYLNLRGVMHATEAAKADLEKALTYCGALDEGNGR